MSELCCHRREHKVELEQTGMRRNWREAITRLEGAYSENTLRSYRADFARFEEWCLQENLCSLPAAPETVAEFIRYDAIKSSPATLRRRLAGIRKVHRLMRLANPVGDEEVLIAMRRASERNRDDKNKRWG